MYMLLMDLGMNYMVKMRLISRLMLYILRLMIMDIEVINTGTVTNDVQSPSTSFFLLH